MPEQRKRSWTKSWGVPAAVIAVAASLLLLSFLTRQDKNPAPAQASASATPSTTVTASGSPSTPGNAPSSGAPGQPDIAAVAHRRDPKDLLSAGPTDAPVVLVVFSDYQCTFCAKWTHDTLPEMRKKADSGQLRIEWRDVNLYGADSQRAARASHAAARQGRFWDYHNELFPKGKTRSKGELSQEALVELAGKMGLDKKRFTEDMASPETLNEITRNEQLGVGLGAFSTPVFLVGKEPVRGAQPTQVFVQAFERELAASKKG